MTKTWRPTRVAFLGSILIVTAALTSVLASPPAPAAQGHTLTYRRIGVGDYQNFLVNWDEKKQSVLYAVVQTPAHYAALFHPAGVNFSRKAFAPDPKQFEKEQILVAGRVMAAPGDMAKVFDVEGITDSGDQLTLRYGFHDPGSKASSTVKNYLAVWIPKRPYKSIAFVENGKPIGELKLARGEWSVPMISN